MKAGGKGARRTWLDGFTSVQRDSAGGLGRVSMMERPRKTEASVQSLFTPPSSSSASGPALRSGMPDHQNDARPNRPPGRRAEAQGIAKGNLIAPGGTGKKYQNPISLRHFRYSQGRKHGLGPGRGRGIEEHQSRKSGPTRQGKGSGMTESKRLRREKGEGNVGEKKRRTLESDENPPRSCA